MKCLYTITAGIGTDKDGNAIDPAFADAACQSTRENISHKLGGVSEVSLVGGWIDNAGKYVEEPSRRWEVVADNTDETDQAIRWQAGVVKIAFHQSAVLVTKAAYLGVEFR